MFILLILAIAVWALFIAYSARGYAARLESMIHDLRVELNSLKNGTATRSSVARIVPVPSAVPEKETAKETKKSNTRPKRKTAAEKKRAALETKSASRKSEPVVETARSARTQSKPDKPAKSQSSMGSGSKNGKPATGVVDREKAFATRWSVWIGGLALAIGGLLIVRYSIESGFFGPGVRLAMGAIFSLALAILSEFIRRRDIKLNVGSMPADQIPSVLAGVSALIAFGVSYASHAVYGFIGPTMAFTIMGAVGITTLIASLVHGRWFGLIGLLGSYVTPFLISGTEPNFAALAIFASTITSVGFLVHLKNGANILLVGAIAGQAVWAMLIASGEVFPAWSVAMLLVAIALAFLKAEFSSKKEKSVEPIERLTALAAFAIPLALGGVFWVGNGGGLWFAAALLLLVAGSIAAAIRYSGMTVLALVAGAGSTGMVLLWPSMSGALGLSLGLFVELISLNIVPNTSPGITGFALASVIVVSLPLLASMILPWRNGAGNFVDRGYLAFASSLTPVCLLLAVSLRMNGFERTIGFAILAAILTLVLGVISEFLFRRETVNAADKNNPLEKIGSAAFASAAAISLGLAIAFGLRETWLVVGFATSAAAIALLARSRKIPLLRSMASMLGTAALARILWQPVLSNIGELPILNWLIVVYGLPALAFGMGAWALAGRRDRPLLVFESLTAFFLSAFVVTETFQAFVGPNLWPDSFELLADRRFSSVQIATDMVAAFSITLAVLGAIFLILKLKTGSHIFGTSEKMAAIAIVASGAGFLGIYFNPLLSNFPIYEPMVFNRFLFDFVGVGLALGLLAKILAPLNKSHMLQTVFASLAIGLIVFGATMIVSHIFVGPYLSIVTRPILGYYEAISIILVWLALLGALVALFKAGWSKILPIGLPAFGYATIGLSLFLLGFWRNPILDGIPVEGPVIFNRILFGYAPVAAGLLAVSYFTGADYDRLRSHFRVAGIALAGLMAFLLSRHFFHGPILFSDLPITMAEAGIYGSVMLAVAAFASNGFSIGSWRFPLSPSPIGAAGFSTSMLGVLLAVACTYSLSITGWLFFNNAMAGFLLPAIVAAVVSFRSERADEELNVSRIYGVAALICGLAYLLLQVRYIFPHEDLLGNWSSGARRTELFSYSFVIIGYGLSLLAVGFRYAHRDLRLGALGVIAIAVFKVFLVDLSGLEGLWRAGTFIGLGASLIGIGYLYRRLEPSK